MIEKIKSVLSQEISNIVGISLVSTANDKNFTYKVDCLDKVYALKVYSSDDFEKFKRSLDFQSYLSERGFKCLSPIRFSGDFIFKIGNSWASLFDYFHGRVTQTPSQKDIQKMVDCMLSFYQFGKVYEGEVHQRIDRLPPIQSGKYEGESKRQNEKVSQLIKEIYGATLSFGLIHGDLNHGQFLLSSTDVRLLDFENFSIGSPLMDLSSFLFFLKCDSRNRHIDDQEIVKRYVDSDVIKPIEVRLIKKTMGLCSRLYSVGRIWQFNNGQVDENEVLKSFDMIKRAEDLRYDGF